MIFAESFGKRISRVIKNEGKAEQQALETSIKELAEIQKMQQAAVKVIYLTINQFISY